MNSIYCISCLCFCCALFFGKTQAQSIESADSIFYRQSLGHAIGLYEHAVGVNSPLYKGKEYVDYDFLIEGDQYFQSYVWENGSVYYDGLPYAEVTMKYDIVHDILIVDHAQLLVPVVLESASVGSFSLLGHNFTRLVASDTTHTGMTTGFYDLMYDGEAQFLVKRKKILKREIEDRRIFYWFEPSDAYYIHKDHMFYKVKNKKSVLKVFYDHKKDIQKFLKRNKIRFGQQREEAIHRIVMYYDEQVQ